MNENDPLPHASWARVYDRVYEQSFGAFYTDLTRATLATIGDIAPAPARIVDFGAGTGRLALPLAQQGHAVTALEPCRQMLDVLQSKAEEAGVRVTIQHGFMHEFDEPDAYDLATCVFTVIIYLLDEQTLQRSLERAFSALKPGGRLLIDAPERALFQSDRRAGPEVRRSVQITPSSGDIFDYVEQTDVLENGVWTAYHDAFQIRHWPAAEIARRLSETGFVLEKDCTPDFLGAGAHYWLWKKPAAR